MLGEAGPRRLPGLVTLFWFRCWSERRNEAETIDFSNMACRCHLIVLFLEKLSLQSCLTSHCIFSTDMQLPDPHLFTDNWKPFSIKENSFFLSAICFMSALDQHANISGLRSFCVPCHKAPYVSLMQPLTADSLKTASIFQFLWQGCPKTKTTHVYVDSVGSQQEH